MPMELAGAACAHGARGCPWSLVVGRGNAVGANACFSKGRGPPDAPWLVFPAGGAESFLFDLDDGTIGYEVNGYALWIAVLESSL